MKYENEATILIIVRFGCWEVPFLRELGHCTNSNQSCYILPSMFSPEKSIITIDELEDAAVLFKTQIVVASKLYASSAAV